MLCRGLLALTLLSMSSCAITQLTLTPAPLAEGVGPGDGKGRVVQLVVPFFDDRPVRNRCGMKKNGYNMDTADLICAEPPAKWIAAMLAAELERSGFEVTTEAEAGDDALLVEGTLLQYFVEPKVNAFTINPEADIHVRLVVSNRAGLLAERDFYVKGIATTIAATSGYFQDASDDAAQAITYEMVDAIVALLDRYPGIATPTPTVPST